MADPGSGIMRFNHATIASVTAIAFDDLNSAAADVSAYVLTWDDSTSTIKGTITVRQGTANFALFDVTGLTDNAGWVEVAVTHVASSGTFTNAVLTFVDFDRTGDAGTGDVNGPGSSVDSEIALFDGITGKAIKRASLTGTPYLTSGVLGTNKVTLTQPATGSTITVLNGKTLTANNSITLAGTDSTTMTFPSSSATIAGLAIAQSWTANQTFNSSSAQIKGSSTGVTSLASANASATSYTATFPAATTSIPVATQTITWSGPSTARTYTLPDAAATLAALGTAQSWTAQQTFKELKDTVHTIADGAAFEIDPANGSVQVVTLGASRSPAATNFEAGQTVLLGVDDGTAYSVTWPSVVWLKNGGTAASPTLATSGFTWVILFKQNTTLFGAIVGSP
jgi:hypothetical protein